MEIVVDLLLLLLAALLGGLVAHTLRLPLLLGYLAAGIALGPFTWGLTVTDTLNPELLAEIGVTLTLFALGVEFSLKSLSSVRKVAFLGTPLQMLITTAYGFGIGMLLGWEWRTAFLLGLLTSLSSTILVQYPLVERHVHNPATRQVIMSILTMQNLLVIPLAFLFTVLHEETVTFSTVIVAILEGSLFLAVLLLIGTQILPRLMSLFVPDATQELRTLIVVASVAMVTYGAYLFNLPFVLAAFAIGLALSESDLNLGTLQELLRVRGLFHFLFFAAAGMLLDIGYLFSNLGAIAVTVVLLAAGKGIILALTTYLSGERNGIPGLAGLGLFQIGELSVVLAWMGWRSGMLDGNTYSLLIPSILTTIVLTPFVLRLASPLRARKENPL